MARSHPYISLILPVFNETHEGIARILMRVASQKGLLELGLEAILVDDGSKEPVIAPPLPWVRVIRHPYNMGNGAAIKTGARHARGKILVFMDADGQHDPTDIRRLISKLEEGFDMVVGARAVDSHASIGRRLANKFYNGLASIMTGHRIDDLTSGFRAARANRFRRFLYLLPNGFSYPTTSTMAFFRSGYPVAYIPIRAEQRTGKSKIKLMKDGLRFFIIILKIGALFSPMRLFLPVSGLFFLLGVGNYAYTYLAFGRFTNMSALLFIASMFTFLIGILSEQVSSLHYKAADEEHEQTERKQAS